MKRLYRFLAVVLLPFLLTLPACRGKEAPVGEQPATSSEMDALATVNGEPVPVSVFKDYVKYVIEARPTQVETVDQRETLLRNFCFDWYLSKKAAKEGFTKMVEGQMFESKLEYLGEFYREKVIVPTVKIDPAEIEDLVGEIDDEMYFSQITVGDEDIAREVSSRVKAGEDFHELAQEYSTGYAGQKGGSIGLVRKSDPRYTPAHREIIFALEEGEVTEPMEHQFGYILIRCDRKTPAEILRQRRWQEIEAQLYRQKYSQAEAAKAAELKAKADIWVDEEYFKTGTKDERRPYIAKVDEQLVYRDSIQSSAGVPHQFDVHSAKDNRRRLDEKINGILFAREAGRLGLDNSLEFLTRLNAFRIKALSSAFITRSVTTFEAVKVTENEIEEYYRNNYKPDVYRLRFILVEEADLADWIREQLLTGADFGRLAKRYSIDPSASKKGELGYYVKGQLRPEFNPYLETLEVGETSPVTPTEDGFGIIQIADHQVVEVPPIDVFRDKIVKTLQLRQRSNKIREIADQEVKGLEISINREMLKDPTFF